MNTFFGQVFFGNSIGDYFWTIGIILFVLFLNRYISKLLASLLCSLFKKKWKTFDEKTFVELVFHPLGAFLVISVCIISLYRLNFPPQANILIYKYSLRSIFLAIGILIQIASFTWLILRIID
ncbi:MAG TPA: hypothetical protein VM935_19430, partial [Chitinophagaceae bacterium]|nr:hypothetical protein [Chitinophagaceae bacterium]